MFWVISVYFNVRNILPKSGTFPPGHLYIVRFYIWRRLSTSTLHCLRLFHSPILRSLSFIAVYIPSFQVLRGRPRFSRPSFLELIIFGNRVQSILSTCPHQMSCFRVMSSIILGVHFFSNILIRFFIYQSKVSPPWRRYFVPGEWVCVPPGLRLLWRRYRSYW